MPPVMSLQSHAEEEQATVQLLRLSGQLLLNRAAVSNFTALWAAGGTDLAREWAGVPSGRAWAPLWLLQRVLCLDAAPPWLQSRTEEEQAGLRSELDIATAEVDRAQQRLLALEGEREKVMQQVGRRLSPQAQATTDPACELAHRNTKHMAKQVLVPGAAEEKVMSETASQGRQVCVACQLLVG